MSEKNHTTSPHTKIIQPLHTQNHATSQQQKNHATSPPKKIMQPHHKKVTQALNKISRELQNAALKTSHRLQNVSNCFFQKYFYSSDRSDRSDTSEKNQKTSPTKNTQPLNFFYYLKKNLSSFGLSNLTHLTTDVMFSDGWIQIWILFIKDMIWILFYKYVYEYYSLHLVSQIWIRIFFGKIFTNIFEHLNKFKYLKIIKPQVTATYHSKDWGYDIKTFL